MQSSTSSAPGLTGADASNWRVDIRGAFLRGFVLCARTLVTLLCLRFYFRQRLVSYRFFRGNHTITRVLELRAGAIAPPMRGCDVQSQIASLLYR